jgi:hypothetical protein
MFDWDTNALVASFVVGSAGFIAFYYGKRMQRFPHLVVGLLLMVFPMFVSDAVWMLVIGAALLISLWVARRLGL